MLEHRRIQHPVGQGFFHSGSVSIGEARFDYIYDCGAFSHQPLSREIESFAADLGRRRGNRHVDALFASHLDRDHVSGLDQLLAGVGVTDVVLPYVSAIERLMLLARQLGAGPLDATYVELIADPPGWFGNRGVRRIVYVEPGDDDNRPPPLPPEPVVPDGGETIGLPEAIGRHVRDLPTSLGRTVEVVRMADTDVLGLQVDGRQLDWLLLTFVHREDRDELAGFRSCLGERIASNLIGDHDEIDRSALLNVLRNHGLRRELRECYRVVRRDINVTSLCLYSGPVRRPEGARSWHWHRDRPRSRRADIACGWLGTGDAKLLADERHAAFSRHYAAIAGQVRTLTLPHHGSRHSFHPGLAQLGVLFVAPVASTGRYGHPHPEVVEAVHAAFGTVVRTTEEPDSTLVEIVSIPPRYY